MFIARIFRLLTYRLYPYSTCRLPQKYPPFGTTTSKYAKNVADTFYPRRPTYPTCLYSHSIFAGGHGKIHHYPVLFIYNRLLLRKMKKEEWLPIVDEKGEVTGQAPRSICHSGSKLLHPVVHLHITNDRHELFLQKRSMKKDLLPGMWDTAVGGHIGVNEKVEDALKREASEELGITDFEARFLGNYVWESPRERELVFSFLCTRYNHIHIDNDEVDEGRFWTLQELAEGMEKNKLTPNLVHEYRLLLKPLFNRS